MLPENLLFLEGTGNLLDHACVCHETLKNPKLLLCITRETTIKSLVFKAPASRLDCSALFRLTEPFQESSWHSSSLLLTYVMCVWVCSNQTILPFSSPPAQDCAKSQGTSHPIQLKLGRLGRCLQAWRDAGRRDCWHRKRELLAQKSFARSVSCEGDDVEIE